MSARDSNMSERYVVNELLAYIQTESENVPPQRMIHVKIKCLHFFEADAIAAARTVLYQSLGMDVGIIDAIDKQSNLLDIFDRFKSTPKDKQPIFVSRDWRKLPQGKDYPATRFILDHVKALIGFLKTPEGENDDDVSESELLRRAAGESRPNRRVARCLPYASGAAATRPLPPPPPSPFFEPEVVPGRYGNEPVNVINAAEYRLFDDEYVPMGVAQALPPRQPPRMVRGGRGRNIRDMRGWRRVGNSYVYR